MMESADLDFFRNPEILNLLMKINEEFEKMGKESPFILPQSSNLKDLSNEVINLKSSVKDIGVLINDIKNTDFDSSSINNLINDLYRLRNAYIEVKARINDVIKFDDDINITDRIGEGFNSYESIGIDIGKIISEELSKNISIDIGTEFRENLSKELDVMGAGKGIDTINMLSEDNDDYLSRGTGSGVLIVLDKLKEDLDQIKYIFPSGKNPLSDWDSSGDMSKNSKNMDILYTLIKDGGINRLIDALYKKLPKPGDENFRDEWDKLKESQDPLYTASVNLRYLLGIINDFNNSSGNFRDIADTYFTKYGNRMPLNSEQFKSAFGRAPKPDTDTYVMDAILSEIAKNGGADVRGGRSGLRAFGFPYEELSRDPDFISRLQKGQLFSDTIFQLSDNKPSTNSFASESSTAEVLLKLLNSLEKGSVLVDLLTQELQKEVDELVDVKIATTEDIPYKKVNPENLQEDILDNLYTALKYDDIRSALEAYKMLDAEGGMRELGKTPNKIKDALDAIMKKYGIDDYKTKGQWGTGFLSEINGKKVESVDDAIKAIESVYGKIYINNNQDTAKASQIGELIRALHQEYGGREGSFELGEGNIDWSAYESELWNIFGKLISGFSKEELDSSTTILRDQLKEETENKPVESFSKPSGCCEELLKIMGEINNKINKVGENIAKALENHVYVFGKGNSSAEDILNKSREANDSNKGKKSRDEYIEEYERRYERFKELSKGEDSELKSFAERAMPYTLDEKNGKWDGKIKDYDLVMAEFGHIPSSDNMSPNEWATISNSLNNLRKRYSKRVTADFKDDVEALINILEADMDTSEDYSDMEKGDVRSLLDDRKTALRKSFENVSTPIKEYIDTIREINKTPKDRKITLEELSSKKLELKKQLGGITDILDSVVTLSLVDSKDISSKGLGDNFNKTILENISNLKNLEIFSEDELELLDLRIKAHEALLYSRIPSGSSFNEALNKYLNALDKSKTGSETDLLYASRRLGDQMAILNESFEDSTEIKLKAIEQINKIIKRYNNDLKKTSGNQRISLENKIKELQRLREGLGGEGEPYIPHKFGKENVPPNPFDYPYVTKSVLLPPMSADMLNALNGSLYGKTSVPLPSMYDYNLLGDTSITGEAKGLFPSEKVKLLSEVYDELIWKLPEVQSKIRQFKKESDIPKETLNKYNEFFNRVKNVHDALHSLKGISPVLDAKINSATKGYGQLALSVGAVIEKTKELNRVSKQTLESVSESNQKAMESLFGGDIKFNDAGEAVKNVGQSTKSATSDFEKFSRNFDYATRSIQGVQNSLISLFKIVGTGNVLSDMTTASSLRQTNKIMLSARRGQEEADKLYDKIQALVVELPGNDTFLTNILTMLGTMDESLTGSDLEYMGGVIADYYMGAQAKGQFNNETERELRNYLMTGQTRNLTNSIIASEIESLKGLNSVKERTVALEKALQATGMDSIAHYDSYTNTFEEFKGRFQKSFADLGDLYLGFVQMLMKVYNFLDRISYSALSQFTIIGGVGALSLTIITMGIGRLLGAIGNVSNGLKAMRDFVSKELPDGTDKYTRKIQELIRQLAIKIGLVKADTTAELENTTAKEFNVTASVKQTLANAWQTVINFKNALSWDTHTMTIEMNTLAQEGNILAKILNRAITLLLGEAQILEAGAVINGTIVLEEDIVVRHGGIIAKLKDIGVRLWNTVAIYDETVAEDTNTVSKNLNIISTIKNIYSTTVETLTKLWNATVTWLTTDASFADALGKEFDTIATLELASATAILDALMAPLTITILTVVGVLLLIVFAMEKVGEAFGWWTDFGSMIDAIGAGLKRMWDAFVNSEQIQRLTYIIGGLVRNIEALFASGSALRGLWEAIFGIDAEGELDIVDALIKAFGTIGGFLWEISMLDEWLEVLRAIGALIGWVLSQWNAFVRTEEFKTLIDDFESIRKLVDDVWTEMKPMFDEVGKYIAEAFGGGELSTVKEDGDELLDSLKDIAQFIHDDVVPILRVVVPGAVKIILGIILTVAQKIAFIIALIRTGYDVATTVITLIGQLVNSVVDAVWDRVGWIVEKLEWIEDKFGWIMHFGQNDKNPTNVANQESGYNQIMTQKYQTDYSKASSLAQNYVNNTVLPTIINNNFSEGSVQPDARNMTTKELYQMFTNAFGYNKTRGVKGILR